jgi:Flp pilus assembly protein TadB
MHTHRSHHRAVKLHAAAPAPAPSGPIRVGDDDRERVVELLRRHAVAGRLDADELEERLERAYAARYGAELQAVLAELPSAAERPHRPARHTRPAFALLPIAVGALVAVAAVSGAWWLMWLIWPLVVVLGPHGRYHRRRGVRA